MIASRFRAVGWVAGVAAAALSCYLVSLQVAAERAQLMKMEGRILAARQDIRQLKTELDTRSRLVQLERWNSDVLGLQAPQVTQYAQGEMQLASYVAPRGEAQVIQAVAEKPAAAPVVTPVSTPAPQPRVEAEPAPAARPRQPDVIAPRRAAPRVQLASVRADDMPAQPMIRRAAYVAPSGSRLAELDAMVHKAALASVAPAPAQPRTRAPLLGDSLLGDIGRKAAAEAKPKAR